MNFKRAIATMTAAGVCAIGLSMPAGTADAAGYATVTVSEGRKAVREADEQGCLTYKELRKIVGGKGHVVKRGGRTHYTWPGKGKALGLYVVTRSNGCADHVSLDYNSGAALRWWKAAS